MNAGDHVLQIQGVSIVDVADIQRVQASGAAGIGMLAVHAG